MTITLRHLQQIEVLAKLRSFAKASRHLGLSQPALSRSISTLEDQLEVKIFDRIHGNISLTVFGRHIIQKGSLVLQEMRVLQRDLNLLRETQAGEINIGCGPFPAQTFIGNALATFHSTHSNIDVNVTVDKTPRLLTLLRDRKLDLFVAETRVILDVQDLDIVSLEQQQGYFCCRTNHPLASLQTLHIQEILNFPIAVMWLPDDIILLLNELSGMRLSKMGDLAAGVIQCDNFEILSKIISTTDAIGIMTERVINRSYYREAITLLPLTLSGLKTHYSIVKNKRYSQPPAVELLHWNIIEAASAL